MAYSIAPNDGSVTTLGTANLLANAAPVKQTFASNYIDFTSAGTAGWAQQYLPELYEQEVERYGDRSLAGFLKMVGAEMPMTSDQVIWNEQGRLHLSYEGVSAAADADSANVITLGADHAVRANQTVVIKSPTAGIVKALVTAVASTTITVKCYASDGLGLTGAENVDLFVFGSEFAKGTASMSDAVTADFTTLTNKPIILKDHYEINGSDVAQIGWVEISGEAGQTGYLWYVKAEGDTRKRFEDYLEMALVEAEKKGSAGVTDVDGTEGLFSAIESRGHIATDVFTNTDPKDDLANFDSILATLDKEGAIEENMMFLNRDQALGLDDMLAAQNGYGDKGTSWGVFNNSESMALNLGFSGFRRGSYDFYKTDWKYLNDASTRGLIGGVKGVMVPAGVSSVYDQIVGKNVTRPLLHVRYRASQTENRYMKTWITGSVGGASTTGDDRMDVHYLSERCLVVQGANNFMILK